MKFARLRKQQGRARWGSKAKQNLGNACSEIARLVAALDLPQAVREEASLFYRTAMQEDLIRGRSIESVAAASVYAACRCGGYTRTTAELAAVSPCAERTIQRAYRVLNAELALDAQLPSPRAIVARLAETCGVSDSVRYRARELAVMAEEHGIANGRRPSGVAAGCLYLAAREHGHLLTQEDVAEAAETTPVTVRARYQELQPLSS